MKNQNQKSIRVSPLHHKAEESLENQHIAKGKLLNLRADQNQNEAELQKLLHELQVYQIELEMQNLELHQAVEKAKIATELYDFAPTGFFTIKPDSSIIQLNFSGARILGKERSKLVNIQLNQFLAPASFWVFDEFIRNIFITRLKQSCEIVLDIQGKSPIFLYLEGIVSGDSRKCLLTAADITERKRTEEALKKSEDLLSLMMKYTPVYTFIKEVTPTESRVLNASENFQQMVGIPGSEMIGKLMDEIFPAEFAAKMTADDWAVCASGKIFNQEEELNERYYRTIKFPISHGDKNLLAGYTIDISEQKQAEQILEKNDARLMELNATKDKFFSIIAHDLRSPFNGIVGFSNILIDQINENNYEGIDEYARIIQNSSQRALSLLMNLLEWSRSQTGRMKFSPEYVEIGLLIDEVAKIFVDTAHQKSIELSIELPAKVIGFGDKDMIGTILRNLISNAIKFTNQGGKIVISAERKPHEILLSVSDNGVGIKKETMGKLFRIETSYSTKGTSNESGTGLGLILCKEFVEKHGGKIWAESEYGKGSKFFFTIPTEMMN